MIFSACPPVYTLPGTWTKCNAIIPHMNLQGGAAFAFFMGLCLFALVVYGIYNTFGRGSKDKRDPIKEHARMHELGIAHGHGGNKDAYEISGKLTHKHED